MGWDGKMNEWMDGRTDGRTHSTYSIPEPSSCYSTYMYLTSRKSAQASSRPNLSPECREMLQPRNCTVLLR